MQPSTLCSLDFHTPYFNSAFATNRAFTPLQLPAPQYSFYCQYSFRFSIRIFTMDASPQCMYDTGSLTQPVTSATLLNSDLHCSDYLILTTLAVSTVSVSFETLSTPRSASIGSQKPRVQSQSSTIQLSHYLNIALVTTQLSHRLQPTRMQLALPT